MALAADLPEALFLPGLAQVGVAIPATTKAHTKVKCPDVRRIFCMMEEDAAACDGVRKMLENMVKPFDTNRRKSL